MSKILQELITIKEASKIVEMPKAPSAKLRLVRAALAYANPATKLAEQPVLDVIIQAIASKFSFAEVRAFEAEIKKEIDNL